MKIYDTLYLKIPGSFSNDQEKVEGVIDALSVALEALKDRYKLNEHEFTQTLNHFSSRYHNLLTAEVYEWKERVGDVLMRQIDYESQRNDQLREAYKSRGENMKMLSEEYDRLEKRFHKLKKQPKSRKDFQIPLKDQPGSKTVKIQPTKRKRKPIPDDL